MVWSSGCEKVQIQTSEVTFYSGKSTSFRTDRPEFPFNTQIVTCFVFLDKLLHFSESLFSCLKMGLKRKRKKEKKNYPSGLLLRMRNTLSTLHGSNSWLIYLLSALSGPVLAEWLVLTEWWIINCGSEFWNLGRLGLGHKSFYLYNSLENSIRRWIARLQWLSRRAAVIDIFNYFEIQPKRSENCLITFTVKLTGF